MTDTFVVHKAPWPSWYADQDGRGVWLHDKASGQKIRVAPPAEWGRGWSWNITEDGTGIYFRRVSA
jgi:hypothetical protein